MPTITFKATDEYHWEVSPKPFPASQAIPKWWRDMSPYFKTPKNLDGKKFNLENHMSNTTFKKCTPMLDALTSGYIFPLWADVFVEEVEGKTHINWRVKGREVFEIHGATSEDVDTPIGYEGGVFKYLNGWIPQLPTGYSFLVTSPFGYQNLPFKAIPAVIDGDKSKLQILPPVWVKKGFEGVVERGTPMFQITPFRRETWKSDFSFYKDGEYRKIEDKNFGATLINNYIKNHWTKKDYK